MPYLCPQLQNSQGMQTLLFLILLIPILGFSQKELQTIDLSDSGNTLNREYLTQLDSVFENSRLIGLGESTHGTSEFTSIRGDLFKYLVENHQYSIFFLEADYNACSRVNRYIHGADDDAKEALLEVRLWPWLTQELVTFIEWMRTYNQNHDNILEFVGCDMQLIVDDREELIRWFATDSNYQDFASRLPDLDFDENDSALLNSKKREWSEFSDDFSRSFPDEEPLLLATVSQWFEEATSKSYRGNFRDSCMSQNMVHYLQSRPESKGIYFAHNGHVGKISNQFGSDQPTFKRAGHFLEAQLNNAYFAIAMEFNIGSFNALNYIDDNYVMEYFTFKKRNRKTLAHFVMGNEDKIRYVRTDLIPSKNGLKIHFIGAIYGKSISGQKIYRYRMFEKDHFDAFIVINQGTPTHLLTMDSRKNKG